jgi:hypothetical protein
MTVRKISFEAFIVENVSNFNIKFFIKSMSGMPNILVFDPFHDVKIMKSGL